MDRRDTGLGTQELLEAALTANGPRDAHGSRRNNGHLLAARPNAGTAHGG